MAAIKKNKPGNASPIIWKLELVYFRSLPDFKCCVLVVKYMYHPNMNGSLACQDI